MAGSKTTTKVTQLYKTMNFIESQPMFNSITKQLEAQASKFSVYFPAHQLKQNNQKHNENMLINFTDATTQLLNKFDANIQLSNILDIMVIFNHQL